MEALKVDYARLRRAAKAGVAVIPMGSVEAHGPHLPCGTDSLIVEAIVSGAAAASDPRRVALLPAVRYSVVEWARPLASVGLAPRALLSALVDLARDVHGLGFRKIVFVQGHGNMPAVLMAIWQLLRQGVRALYVDASPYAMAAGPAREIAGEDITHAGTIETALMLALHPELVDMARAVDGPGDLHGPDFPFAALRGRPGVFCVPTAADLPEGVEGRATRATAEMGRRLLDVYTAAVAEILNDLLDKDVPESFLEPFRKDVGG